MRDYGERLFFRGFLLSDRERDVPAHFRRLSLDGLIFYHHPALDVALVGGLLIAGHAVDVQTGESDLETIGRRLRGSLEALDDLSGRFVVVHDGKVQHDACGLRAVFYSKEQPAVGSHAALVARAVGAPWCNTGLYRYGFPGATTPYRGIYHLTPNTLLEFPFKVRRYFPREDLEPLTVEEAADIVLSGMRTQMMAVRRPLLSLTAGIDSRVTVAAGEGDFFTYRRPGHNGDSVDVSVAKEIALRRDLRHIVIDIRPGEGKEFDSFDSITRQHTYYSHFRSLAFLYSEVFGDEWVHVRSNLGEIGRAFYRKAKEREDLTPAEMARMHKSIEGPFAEFYEDTDFGNACNYDPYDLFYWEHRMGCWHSHVVLESDLAFDTHVLFNARRILKAMLAVPLQDRIEANVFHEIIRRELPELSDIPINPESWPA